MVPRFIAKSLVLTVCLGLATAGGAVDRNVMSLYATHDAIERDYHPAYLKLATAKVDTRRRRKLHRWPVSLLSIGNSNGSFQSYGGRPYFHRGLDLRAKAGSPVYASSGGKVVNIENYFPGAPAYWEVAILDDEGLLWQYHHIERSSIPSEVVSAWRTGGRVEDGAKLGEVYSWDIVSEGERYHHIHVNVAGKDETWMSALLQLEPIADHSPPEIVDTFLTKNGNRVSGDHVSGNYSLAVHARDLVLSQAFFLPPHTLSYAVDGQASVVTWKFDTLPGNSETDYVERLYLPRYTCGNYSCRRPVIDLGFTLQGGQVFPTTPGNHEVEIVAEDFAGNRATKRFAWTVD